MAIVATQPERNLVGRREVEAFLRERITKEELLCRILFNDLRRPHIDERGVFIDSSAFYSARTGGFYSQEVVENQGFLQDGINEFRQADHRGLYIEAEKVTALGEEFFQMQRLLQMGEQGIKDPETAAALLASHWNRIELVTNPVPFITQIQLMYQGQRRVGRSDAEIREENERQNKLPMIVAVLPLPVLARLHQFFMRLPAEEEIRRIALERLRTETLRDDFRPGLQHIEGFEIPAIPEGLDIRRVGVDRLDRQDREDLARMEAGQYQAPRIVENPFILPDEEIPEIPGALGGDEPVEVAGADVYHGPGRAMPPERRAPERGEPESPFVWALKHTIKMLHNSLMYGLSPVAFLVNLVMTLSFEEAYERTKDFLNGMLMS